MNGSALSPPINFHGYMPIPAAITTGMSYSNKNGRTNGRDNGFCNYFRERPFYSLDGQRCRKASHHRHECCVSSGDDSDFEFSRDLHVTDGNDNSNQENRGKRHQRVKKKSLDDSATYVRSGSKSRPRDTAARCSGTDVKHRRRWKSEEESRVVGGGGVEGRLQALEAALLNDK